MPFLLLAALVPLVSAPPPEQTAFNYFATVLVAQYYPHAKRLYLTGHSETEASLVGPFAACFPGTGFDAFWRGQPATSWAPVPIAYRGFPVFKRTGAFRGSHNSRHACTPQARAAQPNERGAVANPPAPKLRQSTAQSRPQKPKTASMGGEEERAPHGAGLESTGGGPRLAEA